MAAVLVAMIVYILANFRYEAAAYATALIVNLLTLAFSFVVALEVILGQEGSAGPA